MFAEFKIRVVLEAPEGVTVHGDLYSGDFETVADPITAEAFEVFVRAPLAPFTRAYAAGTGREAIEADLADLLRAANVAPLVDCQAEL